jgi:hypothetical protein
MAKMVQTTGKSRTELRALLESLPTPLELYMPVDEHREQWTGTSDLMVLGELSEDVAPVAYTLDGVEVRLSQEAPPATPVLALVPVETDFSETLDETYQNVDERGGHAIGTYSRVLPAEPTFNMDAYCDPETAIEPCDGGGGGSGGGSGELTGDPRGLDVQEYITHMRTWNDHEPWWKDDPEFTIFVAGTSEMSGYTDLREHWNIPPEIWTNDEGWKRMPFDMRFIHWLKDYGDRVLLKCIEKDWGGSATLTLSGSTTLSGVEVGFETTFGYTDTDDDCGAQYLVARSSSGDWGYIPDGNSPEYNGTSDLQWYGYGQLEF